MIVFRKFEEHVYLALSQEEGDTEEVLAKKLFVFNRIITMLYGPVHSRYIEYSITPSIDSP